MAGLEHGADGHPEGLPAVVALVDADAGALALQLTDAIGAAAMWANRTVRPHPRLQVRIGSVFVVKMFGVENCFRHDFSSCAPTISRGIGYVKCLQKYR